jgi:hypothetical protein
MSARAKTFDEFALDAAEMVQTIICQLRIIRATKPADFNRDSARGLARIEGVAGDHMPVRSLECGDCGGCGLMPSRPEGAILH